MLRLFVLAGVCLLTSAAQSQTLEQQLLNESSTVLSVAARESGDARRGAILFHQIHIGCVKCHAVDDSSNSLGPDLTKLQQQPDANDAYVVASILKPSHDIRKGYESITVATTDGKVRTGLLVNRSDAEVTLRDPAREGERVTLLAADIDEIATSKLSIMPQGIVNQLSGRNQFLDLLRYVLDIKDGGVDVARKLQPPPGLIAFRLPEYETHVDHAGLIRGLNRAAAKRGAEIYDRLCINCHGNKERPGSLPTALRFADGKFRNGSDPYTMYKTLTHGFGLMVPQAWMVPQQKYDVVHYIRETYVRQPNPNQYQAVTDDYLAALPQGDTFGPEPVEYAPWSDMNYGPTMINTFEIGSDGENFAHKGIAMRLDGGPGGIARGSKWAIFDHDTLRFAAAWTRQPHAKDSGFITWQGIHFDGRHGTHPRVVGDLKIANPTGPGWANPMTGSFEDNQRIVGRDDRNYGPLPRKWAKYKGLHTVGSQTIVEYTVHDRTVLERFDANTIRVGDAQSVDVFTRTMSLGASADPSRLLVATHPETNAQLQRIGSHSVILKSDGQQLLITTPASKFNGTSYLQVEDGEAFDMTNSDFTISARIRTTEDGTIFSKTAADGPWAPNGKSLFLRNGRLTYDIGWVGAATSKQPVNDGKWHNVAMTWDYKTARVNFFIDGKPNDDGNGNLRPQAAAPGQVARIGFSAANFPDPSFFNGEIEHVVFHQKRLSSNQIKASSRPQQREHTPIAAWDLNSQPVANAIHGHLAAASENGRLPAIIKLSTSPKTNTSIFAGVIGVDGVDHKAILNSDDGRLIADLPTAEKEQQIVVWTATVSADLSDEELRDLEAQIQDRIHPQNLRQQIDTGGAARWPDVITTVPELGADNGPFAIDVLSTPAANPWLARIRLTGQDFLSDGDRVAVCSWDGDVWMVSGLKTLNGTVQPQLKWQRIASGLFQPLGVKVVDDEIYVTCRDQLVILRDRNGDGETDFYECFNNDHQVTEHFHEFAMGLQRDATGNFYYAKSARHAKTALVPHHGTLLRIPPDGSRTDIVANGFRAANGVCLNPDGSFIVTDQEGHWNPKNRINWVREGGFYGNMFGYHNVTDDSDDAMQQPLCWITNAFDRSPAELMWINNKAWGPLDGTLLNLSYGYGKVYVVPHEEVAGQMQGGMCELPIPQFPTGIARGRISDHDNGLYLSGMFAWGSSQQAQEGGFYRLRYTGQPANMPVGLNAAGKELKITFTDPLDQAVATSVQSYAVKVWSLKRTANYGSEHYDEHPIEVAAAQLSENGKAVTLTIPELSKTWCMEIKCKLKSADGEEFERVIHNTIHRVD